MDFGTFSLVTGLDPPNRRTGMGLGSNLTMAPVRQGAKWALGAHRTPFETAQAGVTVRLFGGPLPRPATSGC